MRLKAGRLLVAIVGLCIIGCASTTVTSRRNPEYTGAPVTSVIAAADLQDLDLRTTLEARLCAELRSLSECECYAASEAFFLGRSYSEGEIRETLVSLGVEAVLLVTPLQSGVSSAHVPGATWSRTRWQIIGNQLESTTTTHSTPGYSITRPWMNAEMRLESLDGTVLWYGTSKSVGSRFSSWAGIQVSLATETVSSLLKRQVVAPTATRFEMIDDLDAEKERLGYRVVSAVSSDAVLTYSHKSGDCVVEIVDRHRRMIARLSIPRNEAVENRVRWNRRTWSGKRAAAGLYEYFVFDDTGLVGVGRIRL